VFDPFFLIPLVLGPFALAWLLRNELRRDERTFRPDGFSILLGILAALGLREWILLIASLSFGTSLEQLPPVDLRSYALWFALILVGVVYLSIASVRMKRRRNR
jgi:hypothetical protein